MIKSANSRLKLAARLSPPDSMMTSSGWNCSVSSFTSSILREKSYNRWRTVFRLWNSEIWAATRQNQQNGCAPSEDSDQPGHLPSLIRVFTVRMKKVWVLSYPLSAQWRLWSDWTDAQANLSLRWAHTHFVGFVMSRLILTLSHLVDLSILINWNSPFPILGVSGFLFISILFSNRNSCKQTLSYILIRRRVLNSASDLCLYCCLGPKI